MNKKIYNFAEKMHIVFWIQLIVAIFTPVLAYMGVKGTDITSWYVLGQTVIHAFSNPYLVGIMVFTAWTAITNPNTSGISDDDTKTYTKGA